MLFTGIDSKNTPCNLHPIVGGIINRQSLDFHSFLGGFLWGSLLSDDSIREIE